MQNQFTHTLFKQQHLIHLWGMKDFPESSTRSYKFCIISLNASFADNDNPVVYVAISEQADCLQLSYFIEKKPWLSLESFQKSNFVKQDFLWEKNCLECFIELSSDSDYLEANISPSGAYNLYHFDSYRQPDVKPPVQDKLALVLPHPNLNDLDGWYQYHVTIKLGEYLPYYVHQRNKVCQITKINPCLTLYRDKQPIYYAKNNANPPDFHNKQYWQNF